jgi:predicted dehydrogenase
LNDALRLEADLFLTTTTAPIHEWPSARAHADAVGAAVWECAWHDLQLAHWLFAPHRSSVAGAVNEPDRPNILIDLRHENGRRSMVRVIDSRIGAYTREWDFIARARAGRLMWTSPPGDLNEMYVRQTQHLLEVAAGRAESIFPLEHALPTVRVCEDAVRSLRHVLNGLNLKAEDQAETARGIERAIERRGERGTQ